MSAPRSTLPQPPSASSSASSASFAQSTSSATGPQLWLVKLPNFVADHFKRSMTGTAPLAQLEVTAGEHGSQQLKLKYQPSDPAQPKEFIIKPRMKRSMLVFQDSSSTTSNSSLTVQSAQPQSGDGVCKLLGPVTVIADATPVDSAEYRAFIKSRTVARAANNNTQRFDESKDMRATPQTVAEQERLERKKRTASSATGSTKAGKPEKRARGEREEVESLLLRAFDQQQFYTFRQLEDLTNQPKLFLQEILNGMCVRETKGENKDKYQLNEKYRID